MNLRFSMLGARVFRSRRAAHLDKPFHVNNEIESKTRNTKPSSVRQRAVQRWQFQQRDRCYEWYRSGPENMSVMPT
jgi:hypothetical protein